MKKTIFITGIDTDSGKSYATGILAAWLLKQGKSVITQKIVQTGCINQSDDILTHRKLMNLQLQKVDNQKLTAPYIFSFPASPHLAAELSEQTISLDKIYSATNTLLKTYDIVLLEGAGGLLSPITRDITTADYISMHNYPVIVVTSAKIGSINHTLLTIEALKCRNIKLLGLIYNLHPVQNIEISKDSKDFFYNYLIKYKYEPIIADLPEINLNNLAINLENINFAELFENLFLERKN